MPSFVSSKSVQVFSEARALLGRSECPREGASRPPDLLTRPDREAVPAAGPRMAVALPLVCLLCSQILRGHPPPYAVDVTAQAPAGPPPAAVLSPPVPEGLPPAAPERLPQLPSSQAPAPMAATPSLPVQSTALPPANLPLTSGPGLSSLSSAVQLTVELAPEVCGLGLPHGTLMPGPAPVSAPDVGGGMCTLGHTVPAHRPLLSPDVSFLNAFQVEGVGFLQAPWAVCFLVGMARVG